MEDVMDSAVGPHFSGLRLDSRRLSSSSLPSPPSSAKANGNGTPDASAAKGFASPKEDGTRSPFVIGNLLLPRLAASDWLVSSGLSRLEFSAR
jgi:uridine kinase